MALWVLEASARAPVPLPDGPLHRVRAVAWVQRHTDFGAVCLHTFLLDVLPSAADPATRLIVESLLPRVFQAWDMSAKPAPDGTYVDTESRTAVVVRGGAIVAEGTEA